MYLNMMFYFHFLTRQPNWLSSRHRNIVDCNNIFFCSSFIFTLFLLNWVVLGSNLMVCFSWVYIGFLRRRGNNLTLGWWLMSWPSFGSPKIVLQKNTFFLLKNLKKPEIKNPRIFLGNGEISLWAATGQKARRIVTMRYFDKTNWRKT
jgi:hypothetical protein